VAVRPSVPSNGPDPNDDRNRVENSANDGADRDDADRDDADRDDAEPWSREWDAEIEPPRAPATEVRFRCDQRFMWVKFIGAAIFIATPIVARASATGLIVGAIVGAGLVVYGARDVLAPVRLAADTDGVTVTAGFAGHRRLAWSEIDRVRLDERSRYGGRQALLEVDAGESLHFFSRYDLGMPPAEALELLREVRGEH
jgi:hypothetical protein